MKWMEPKKARVRVNSNAIVISEPRMKCVGYSDGSGYVVVTGKDADGNEVVLVSTDFDLRYQKVNGSLQYLGKTAVHIKDIPVTGRHVAEVVTVQKITTA